MDVFKSSQVIENFQQIEMLWDYIFVDVFKSSQVIENFQQIEMLWDYIFVDVLKIAPEKHAVLLTEPPYNPKPNRERMVELMFEVGNEDLKK